MENLIVDVKLWGQLVGSLVWDDATEMAVFEYDSRFRRNGLELAPLTMPLSTGNHPFSFPANRTECFMTVGENAGIRRCSEIIDEINDTISHWSRFAQDSGVRESHITEIERNLLLL